MELSAIEREKIRQLINDPVTWAKTFIVSNDAITKQYGPWVARDYQEEMLRDKSHRKVYRCGRRTGKSEVMVVDGLHKAFTHKNFRILYVTPYENQVRLLFMRMKEIINDSPLLKAELKSIKSNPYMIEWKNGSAIIGFTTGASTGQGAASVRGQRADWIFLDEMDYMGENDYGTISMIAGERSDIGMTVSSTPTGKRGTYYQLCMNKELGYSEHHHPSTHNPSWNEDMEAEFRGQLTSSEFEHEIMAEFGTEDAGVFDKDKLDIAFTTDDYAYQELDRIQERKAQEEGRNPRMFMWPGRAPANAYRTMGIDWDKFQSSSSIVILDYDVVLQKFRVILRLETPKSEYSYDAAVKTVIDLNEKYNPSWIFADRGSGEYQIERIHLYGDEHPKSGLKEKLVGWQFKNKVEVIDPVTRTVDKKPMKPFMVNQLTIAFERERMILSQYDETMRKQLTDYVVERVSQNGDPVYTSENEHSVDALGLAYLAMVLKFPNLTDQVKMPEYTSKVLISNKGFGERSKMALEAAETGGTYTKDNLIKKIDQTEIRGERANYVKIPLGQKLSTPSSASWGSRRSFTQRSMW